MSYFLLGSAFSFGLKKLRPGKKLTVCYAAPWCSPPQCWQLALHWISAPRTSIHTGSGARPWALKTLLELPSQSLGKHGPKQNITNVQLCLARHARPGLQWREGAPRDREMTVSLGWCSVICTNDGKRFWIIKMMDNRESRVMEIVRKQLEFSQQSCEGSICSKMNLRFLNMKTRKDRKQPHKRRSQFRI